MDTMVVRLLMKMYPSFVFTNQEKYPYVFLILFSLLLDKWGYFFLAFIIYTVKSVYKWCIYPCFFYKWQVIPFSRGSAWEQPPPDLASYLYKNRIVYLGMSLVPSVTELILAEFLYLQYEDEEKPIYLYVNSTGTTKVSFLFLFVDHIMLMMPPFVQLALEFILWVAYQL